MASNDVNRLIDMLYERIEDAKSPALKPNMSIVDRDEMLDLLDELRAAVPVEVKRAQELLAAREKFVEDAKRDVERPDRMEKLARVGALDKWERFFAALEAFCGRFGRLPGKDEFLGDLAVGAWLHRQRAAMRRGELSEEQRERLARLGVVSSDWEKKFGLVVAFREEFGRLPKFEDTYRGVKVGRWLYAQRKALDPEKDVRRVALLRQLGALPFVRQKNKRKPKKQ